MAEFDPAEGRPPEISGVEGDRLERFTGGAAAVGHADRRLEAEPGGGAHAERAEQVGATGLGVGGALAPVGEEVGAQQFTRTVERVAGLDGVTDAEAHRLTVGGRSGVETVREVELFEHGNRDGALGHGDDPDFAIGARHDAILEQRADAMAKPVDTPVRSVGGPRAGEEAFEVEAGLTDHLGRGALAVQAVGPTGRAHARDGAESQPVAGDHRPAETIIPVDTRGRPRVGGKGRGLEVRRGQLGGRAFGEVADAQERAT